MSFCLGDGRFGRHVMASISSRTTRFIVRPFSRHLDGRVTTKITGVGSCHTVKVTRPMSTLTVQDSHFFLFFFWSSNSCVYTVYLVFLSVRPRYNVFGIRYEFDMRIV